jgi:hypothetical protein
MSGGLGNQLFQYAAGLAVARRLDAELLIDLREYRRPHRDRELLLDRFAAPLREASRWQIVRASRWRHYQRGTGQRDDVLPTLPRASWWLRGFWEHTWYIAGVEPELRRLYVPRDPAVGERARGLVESARRNGGPVVAVHVRRGDRAAGNFHASPFSTLPGSYYQAAAARFASDATFVVLSDTGDDIAWCRAHLGLGDDRTVVFGDGTDPVLDLMTLAAADHVIASASTFSWWGAWLNTRPGRRVIVPDGRQAAGAAAASSLTEGRPIDGAEVVTFPPPYRCFRPRGGRAD